MVRDAAADGARASPHRFPRQRALGTCGLRWRIGIHAPLRERRPVIEMPLRRLGGTVRRWSFWVVAGLAVLCTAGVALLWQAPLFDLDLVVDPGALMPQRDAVGDAASQVASQASRTSATGCEPKSGRSR